jgi:hypothetical protein
MLSEPVEQADKGSIMGRWRCPLRFRTRLRCLTARFMGEACAHALDASIGTVWHVTWRLCIAIRHGLLRIARKVLRLPQSVRHFPHTYWLSCYRLCFIYVLCIGKLPRVYWWWVYRLCFALVLLRARGQAMWKRVWQHCTWR